MMDNWNDNFKKQLGKVKRVEPGPDLYQKIEQRLSQSTGAVVSINRVKVAAAAAILVLLNAAVLWATFNNTAPAGEQVASYTIVSNYNIYTNE